MEVLAIIQARGGSKRLPGKNIKSLGGKPLISWTIEAAKNARYVSRVIVSTDDAAIASVAKAAGAEVPFMRPAELATDTAKSHGLLEHALLWLKEHEGYVPDLVVQLKPVNPLRTAATIDACIEQYDADNFDSLITVQPVSEHPYKTWRFDASGHTLEPFVSKAEHGLDEPAKMPKQLLAPAYIQNSCVHIIAPSTILKKSSSIGIKVQGFVMDAKEGINIDTEEDFVIAGFLISQLKHK